MSGNNNTKDFTLPASVGGGRISSFRYSHSLRELVGSWSASVAGGTFKAGDAFSVRDVMNNGIIASAYKDNEGLWHLEGKDAGYRLMKSLPAFDALPQSKTFLTFIRSLASSCSVTVSSELHEDDDSFQVRSLVSGSTYAEAILEAAMFAGYIVYFNHDGQLVVQYPSKLNEGISAFGDVIISDSASSLELDGYATHVLLQLSYKHKSDAQEEGEAQSEYLGEEPPNVSVEYHSGILPNGIYSFEILQPFGVTQKLYTKITDGGITIENTEQHTYTHHKRVLWRENQEFGLYAFIETAYTLTRSVTGSYSGQSFSEKTTETMQRTLSGNDLVIGIPADWEDYGLDMVDAETVTRSTVRTGGPAPAQDMPAYSPPFDSQVTRSYQTLNRGRVILCHETEETYEARQVGAIAPVTLNGQPIPHFFLDRTLAVQTHVRPEWVLVKAHRDFFDQFDEDGSCVVSTRAEYSDEGNEWVSENALVSTGDEQADAYQKAYAAFTQAAQGLQVSFGSPHFSTAWQFLEVQGRTRNTPDKNAALGDVSTWYDAGAYVKSIVCPHYNQFSKSCNVYMFAGNIQNHGCNRLQGTLYWMLCDRAIEALNKARELDTSELDAPVFGSAGSAASGAGYKRDVYIDEELKEKDAQTIANTLAQNILAVKSSKGFCKTVVIPYSTDYLPDGDIIEVAHDWDNLQTSITYRTSGNIPSFLISQSAASVADFVAARYNSRASIPKYGKYLRKGTDDKGNEKDNEFIVSVDNSEVKCSSKLRYLQENDIVLVIFPAGNKVHGQIIARL